MQDVLSTQTLGRYLEGEWNLHCMEEIDSTNTYLKCIAAEGAPHGTVAVANRQTGGRGRMGRSFQSPEGKGIYLSILLRPKLSPEEMMPVTALAAVAVCNAVEQVCGIRPKIKWTNDIVLGGKKLCGILTESVLGGDGQVMALVIGVGINVHHRAEDFTEDVAAIATSLDAELGREISRPELAAALCRNLLALGERLGGDYAAELAAYRRDCLNLGREVRLLWSGSQETVTAVDVDEQFGLVIRRADGTEDTVRSGEVSVRGLYGYVE